MALPISILEALTLPLRLMSLRCPNVELKVPRVSRPSWKLVFGVILASYFLVTSGIIYDAINEPPSTGQTFDEATGTYKPEAFMKYRINGQYIIEGLSGGLLYALGGMGFVLLDFSNSPQTLEVNRKLYLIGGSILIVVSFIAAISFLRMKVPNYMS